MKTDAHDQLLLSEGVCRQLGILAYHPDVKARKDGPQCEEESKEVASVPTIRVCLLQSVRVPAGQSTFVPVHFQGSDLSGKSMLLERDPSLRESTGLQFEDALLQHKQLQTATYAVHNDGNTVSETRIVFGQLEGPLPTPAPVTISERLGHKLLLKLVRQSH